MEKAQAGGAGTEKVRRQGPPGGVRPPSLGAVTVPMLVHVDLAQLGRCAVGFFVAVDSSPRVF